ncbi:Crp/Fnr family transcriptional regulator [Pseudonocardia nematodicida]|uniref:Crp/Fnr family transcriptional regulator n=1 Tax=Pseudonocardia nematodicida TaxID=1206997 RepID=A0ABV1KDF1_9PSEU
MDRPRRSAYSDAQTAIPPEEVDVDADRSLTTWIRDAGRIRSWSAGAHVIRQGERSDSVVLLRSGSVKVLAHSPVGKQVVLALRGPGDVLGEFGALDELPRSAGVVALTDADGWVVPASQFRARLTARPDDAVMLLRLLVSRLREADLRRLEFGSLDTTSRVAVLLVSMDDGEWIGLTQTEMGEAVGASREATVKALARLRSAGVVETGRGRVRVLRSDLLRRAAAGTTMLPD